MVNLLEKRKTLRNYQEENKNIIISALNDHDKVVLAMSPNSGKTITASRIIEDMLKGNKIKRVLFLAEGQSVLRKQNFEALEDDLKHSDLNIKVGIVKSKSDLEEAEDANVIVTLPQTINNYKFKNKIDLLVVDEAHNRYITQTQGAGQLQNIINRNKLNKQLLLTGTPSCFIYANKKDEHYFIHNFTLLDLIDAQFKDGEKYVSNINCYVSTWNIGRKDIYNNKGDIKSTVKIKDEDTDEILDKALQEMMKTQIIVKDSKIMLVCPTISFANRIYRKMLDMNYSCILSNSIDDSENENIEEFKSNNDINFLIVVNRGILGFNMPSLDTIIDISGTKNVNRIYQMFNRLTRVKEFCEKKFIKVSFDGELEMTRYRLIVALSLSGENIKIYDGTGSNKLEFPVSVVKGNKNFKGREIKLSSNSFGGLFSSNYFEELDIIDVFYDVYYKKENTYKVTAYSSMDAVKEFYNRGIVIEELKAKIIENGSSHFSTTEHSELNTKVNYYYRVNKEFREWINETYPRKNWNNEFKFRYAKRINQIKEEILKVGGPLPSTHPLFSFMYNYKYSDEKFAEWLKPYIEKKEELERLEYNTKIELFKSIITEYKGVVPLSHEEWDQICYYLKKDDELKCWFENKYPHMIKKKDTIEDRVRKTKKEIEEMGHRPESGTILYSRAMNYRKRYPSFKKWFNKNYPAPLAGLGCRKLFR